MSETVLAVGELLNQIPDELVVCKYGTGDSIVQVQVPKNTLLLFRIFRDINDDCPSKDNSFYANIPTIYNAAADRMPILFNETELALFFELSASTSAKEPITTQHLENSTITPELLTRFMHLADFLDYKIYLNTLCKYAAFLVIESKLTFSQEY